MSVEATARTARAKASAATAAPVQTAQDGGEKLVRTRGFEWFSRAGFLARAAIYFIVGVLALELGLGVGGKATNQQGALATIARQPFGKVPAFEHDGLKLYETSANIRYIDAASPAPGCSPQTRSSSPRSIR